MKIEVSDDELEMIDKSLRFYYAYMVSQNREYSVYQTLADRLKNEQRKPAESEQAAKSKKRAG